MNFIYLLCVRANELVNGLSDLHVIKFLFVLTGVNPQTESVDQKPDNGNDLVPLGGRVSEGMAEALGLDIDNEALSS